MNPMISAAVCLPALVAILAIGLWVLIDHVQSVQSEPVESGPAVIGEDGRLSGQVWASSYPVETPTTELPVLVRSHRAARGWTR